MRDVLTAAAEQGTTVTVVLDSGTEATRVVDGRVRRVTDSGFEVTGVTPDGRVRLLSCPWGHLADVQVESSLTEQT